MNVDFNHKRKIASVVFAVLLTLSGISALAEDETTDSADNISFADILESSPIFETLTSNDIEDSGYDAVEFEETSVAVNKSETISKQGSGSVSTFESTPVDVSEMAVVSGLGSYPFTGSAVEPEPIVKVGSKILVKDTDYTLSYSDNVYANYDAECHITFINDYTGSITATFRIEEAEYTVTYSGGAVIYEFGQVPFVDIYEVTVHCADGTEFSGSDIGSVGVIDDGNYTFEAGTAIDVWCSGWNVELAEHGINTDSAPVLITLPVEKRVFTQEDVVDMKIETYDGDTLQSSTGPYWGYFPDKDYTGEEIEFSFGSISFCTDYWLAAPDDFTYSYRDNIQPGIGYVVITFKGDNIEGTVEIPFDIIGWDFEGVTISGYDDSYVYTGSYIRPAIKVSKDGEILTQDKDYTLKFINNVDAGTANITVTGINAYSGIKTAYFTITPKSGAYVYVSPIGDVIFSGVEITPLIEIVDRDR